MNKVCFEGFGIKDLNISSIAIEIGNFKIYWYAILIVLGIILAILFCKKDDGKYNIKFDNILELAIFVIPISIISARIYYIMFKLGYYISNPIEIFNFRDGGLAIYGGIIGAIIAIAIYCKIKKIIFLDVLDYIAPYLPLAQSIGRWGNFFNQEAYGYETNNLFRMGIIENGKYIQVHPTFLYESICTFIIFIILFANRRKRKFSGEQTCLYFFLYGFIRMIIEGFRTDSLMLGNIRVSQLLSLFLCITFGSILIYKKIKIIKKEKD